jgi:hypothetical protein
MAVFWLTNTGEMAVMAQIGVGTGGPWRTRHVRRHIPDSDEAFMNKSTNNLGFLIFVGSSGPRYANGGYPAVLSVWGRI